MITVIKTKANHLVHRKKRQGGTHQNAGSDCVPFGNSFSLFLRFKKMCLWYMQNVKNLFKKLVWGGMKLKKQKAPCDLIIQTQYMFLLLKCPCSHTCLFFIAAVLTNAALYILLILQPIFNIISYFYIVFITGMCNDCPAFHGVDVPYRTIPSWTFGLFPVLLDKM